MAQHALLLARTTPITHMGRAILQNVYFPAGDYSRRLRSLESYNRLRRATREVKHLQRSWWSAFKARTSWLLHSTEVSLRICRSGTQHTGSWVPARCVLQTQTFRTQASVACAL